MLIISVDNENNRWKRNAKKKKQQQKKNKQRQKRARGIEAMVKG